MGEYDGGFDHINSAYKNLPDEVDGIQNFTYLGSEDYFTNIKEDWSYSEEIFTYTKEDSSLLKNFQFFAAPMLLKGKVELKTINIKLVSEELSIELVDKTDAVVSTAKVTKGY